MSDAALGKDSLLCNMHVSLVDAHVHRSHRVFDGMQTSTTEYLIKAWPHQLAASTSHFRNCMNRNSCLELHMSAYYSVCFVRQRHF